MELKLDATHDEICCATLPLTSGSLVALHATGTSGRTTEVVALVSANLTTTVLRFLLLRTWVFGGAQRYKPV